MPLSEAGVASLVHVAWDATERALENPSPATADLRHNGTSGAEWRHQFRSSELLGERSAFR